MPFHSVLLLMIWIAGPAFLIGSVLQLRGRPVSLFRAAAPTTSRLDRLAVFLTWLGIAFGLPAVVALRSPSLRRPGLMEAQVPLVYVILGAAFLVVGTMVILRERSRCDRCGRTILPEGNCPYCPEEVQSRPNSASWPPPF